MAIKVSGTEVISDDKRILNNEDLPDIRPSLLLDFANSKTLDPRITFTRGSTATYWDGKTTAKAEENLFIRSQEFDNSNWAKVRVNVTANATTAPDGTTTADAINQASGETTIGRVFRSNVTNSAGVTTVSIYAKANTRNFLSINTHGFVDTGFNYTYFNLSTGAVGNTFSGHTASITDVGNGWYRCSITLTSVAAGSFPDIGFGIADTDGSTTVTDDQKGIYIWGAQLEQRSSATAYTATTSSPIVKYQPVLQTAASGEARFDHDPVTGESKGLLIEEARTNLSANSVPVTGWSAHADIELMGYAAAPDGTLTAPYYMQVGTNSDASNNNTDIGITPSASTNYVISCFVKQAPDGYDKAHFYNFFVGSSTKGSRFEYTFSTDTIDVYEADNGGVVPFNYGREFVGNGWVRIWYVVNDANSGLNNTLGTRYYPGGRDANNYQGLIVWGFQVEEGSFPTSYIPTSGSTVTRAGDYAAMSSSEIGYYGGDFTVYSVSTVARDNTVGGPTPVLIGSRLASSTTPQGGNYHYQYYRANGASGSTVYLANTIYADTNPTGTITANQELRIATAYSKDDFATSGNGGTVLTDASVPDLYGINSIHFGNGAQLLNGHLSKVAFWNERLPNATLQAMTEA